jgi:hypothetical protein
MIPGRSSIAALLASILLLSPVSALAQGVTLETVLARTSAYVAEFIGRFSNVVTEERYEQNVSGFSQLRNSWERQREMKSDFLLVRTSDTSVWIPFRDVFEVNGESVRDREQRLARLFLESSSSALSRAQEITNEGVRYNLGNKTLFRTVNNPLMGLAFLQREHHRRFRFELGRRDTRFGPEVYVLGFREVGRPTFVRGASDTDLPARGRFWIDTVTGRVAQMELILIEKVVQATLTTVFQHDDRLQIDAPAEMTERYQFVNGGLLTGRATYTRFRRFDVSTDEKIEKPR